MKYIFGDVVKYVGKKVTWEDGFTNVKGDLGVVTGNEKADYGEEMGEFSILVVWKKMPDVIQNCCADELELKV